MKHEESDQQKIVVRWFRGYFPHWKNLLHGSNSGINVGPRVGMRLSELGLCPGQPDLHIALPAGGYHGLYIEMKTKGGKVTAIQKEVHDDLRDQGHQVLVCWSSDEAIKAILDYLRPLLSYSPAR